MQTIELRPAFVWSCETCGRENFARAVVAEMSEDDRTELKEEFGMDEVVEGDFLMRPNEVTCEHCGETFASESGG